MAKKIRKAKTQTAHGVARIKERTDLSKNKEVLTLIRAASRCGKSPHYFRHNKRLHSYLVSKCSLSKRVKIYNGYIFIFNGGSNRLITMYPLKEKWLKEYEEYVSK